MITKRIRIVVGATGTKIRQDHIAISQIVIIRALTINNFQRLVVIRTIFILIRKEEIIYLATIVGLQILKRLLVFSQRKT